MATIRKASMPSRRVMTNICSMALSLMDAGIGHEPDAGDARLAGFSHHFSDHLILRGFVRAQMQLRRRIDFSSRRYALRELRVIDALAIPEQLPGAIDGKRD